MRISSFSDEESGLAFGEWSYACSGNSNAGEGLH